MYVNGQNRWLLKSSLSLTLSNPSTNFLYMLPSLFSFLFTTTNSSIIYVTQLLFCSSIFRSKKISSMGPAKFHGGDHEVSRKEMIKGTRPSPLKVNKESQVIQKPSFYSSSMSTSSVSDYAATTTIRQQRRQPVIIYTQSPKIIKTQARDFMALVQKLTGQSRSKDEDQTQKSHDKPVGHDDNDSCSALTDEKCGGGDVKSSSSSLSPIQNQTNPYFADIPLFTPNSNNFFCSPRPVYRYPDSAFVSPNMGNSMSPSVLEFIKGLPEY